MEFQAEKKGSEIIIKAKSFKDKQGNVEVHVPSLPMIKKLKQQIQNGKRNI